MNRNLNEQHILQELHQVPYERWLEVVSFIRSLRPATPVPDEPKRSMTASDLLHSGLVGMWASRPDLGENHEFARRLREHAQMRCRNA